MTFSLQEILRPGSFVVVATANKHINFASIGMWEHQPETVFDRKTSMFTSSEVALVIASSTTPEPLTMEKSGRVTFKNYDITLILTSKGRLGWALTDLLAVPMSLA